MAPQRRRALIRRVSVRSAAFVMLAQGRALVESELRRLDYVFKPKPLASRSDPEPSAATSKATVSRAGRHPLLLSVTAGTADRARRAPRAASGGLGARRLSRGDWHDLVLWATQGEARALGHDLRRVRRDDASLRKTSPICRRPRNRRGDAAPRARGGRPEQRGFRRLWFSRRLRRQELRWFQVTVTAVSNHQAPPAASSSPRGRILKSPRRRLSTRPLMALLRDQGSFSSPRPPNDFSGRADCHALCRARHHGVPERRISNRRASSGPARHGLRTAARAGYGD